MNPQARSAFLAAATLALFAATLAASAHATVPARGQVSDSERKTCADPIQRQERGAGIPNQLLAAVARAESGRWDKTASASFAWPWTVTAEGKGQFFASKEEAIAQVERLRARGIRNIDVGCMQINLMHHPDAFANLDEALDPETNVAYATRFLKQLFEQSRSWVTAVGNYHSATPEFHMRYRQKVMQLWTDERRRDAERRRQETLAAYYARRQSAPGTAPGVTSANASLDSAADEAPRQMASSEPMTPLQRRFAPRPPAQTAAPTPPPMRQPVPSLRVQSRIPTAGDGAAASSSPNGGSLMPNRSTVVPLERR